MLGLGSALMGPDCHERVFAMIAAYYDDSGTDVKHPALVVGGCIATVENWAALQKEWSAILSEYEIEYFHMTDFDNRRKQFSKDKFREEDRIPLQSKLLAELKKRLQAIVAIATNKLEYAPWERHYNCKLYAFTVFECLSAVEDWANDVGYDGPIAYIFDQGGGSKELGGRGCLEQLKNDIIRDSRLKKRFHMKELESWSYGFMKSLNPLQAADVIAYEAWKDLQNDFFAKQKQHWRISATKLITNERIYQGYFGEKEFSANHFKWNSRIARGKV
jgi:hypothetical protein